MTDDMTTPGDGSDDYTLYVLTPEQKIALLKEEIERLKAENETLKLRQIATAIEDIQ